MAQKSFSQQAETLAEQGDTEQAFLLYLQAVDAEELRLEHLRDQLLKLAWRAPLTYLELLQNYLKQKTQPAFVFLWLEQSLTIQHAIDLAETGEREQAFLAYAAIPNAQYFALSLAKPLSQHDLQSYLERLESAQHLSTVYAQLLKGELLTVLGETQAALTAYRTVAKHLPSSKTTDAREIFAFYLVESSTDSAQTMNAFVEGTGSQSDNRLIRRLIALDAFEDAAREFERIWQFYLNQPNLPCWQRSSPLGKIVLEGERLRKSFADVRLFDAIDYDAEQTTFFTVEQRLAQYPPIEPKLLQFALDYAYFLRRFERQTQSEAVLFSALAQLAETKDFSHCQLLDLPNQHKSFLRICYGFFQDAKRVSVLFEGLQTRVAAGDMYWHRIIAWFHWHQRDTEQTLQQEILHLQQLAGKQNPPVLHYYRGRLLAALQQPEAALQAYQQALSLYPTTLLSDAQQAAYLARNWRQTLEELQPLAKIHAALCPATRFAAWEQQAQQLHLQATLLECEAKQLNPHPDRPRPFHFRELEKNAKKFAQTGETNWFHSWLREQSNHLQDAEDRANCLWFLGDYDGYRTLLSEFFPKDSPYYFFHQALLKQQQFIEAGQPTQFLDWLRGHRADIADTSIQADIACLFGEYQQAANLLAASISFDHVAPSAGNSYATWLLHLLTTTCAYTHYGEAADSTEQQRFQQQDKTPLRRFLNTLLSYHPNQARLHFDLLNLQENVSDAERMHVYAQVVRDAQATNYAIGQQYGDLGRFYENFCTLFPDRYSLAYRLMRLYEQHGQIAELCELGFAIARSDMPFEDWQASL